MRLQKIKKIFIYCYINETYYKIKLYNLILNNSMFLLYSNYEYIAIMKINIIIKILHHKKIYLN